MWFINPHITPTLIPNLLSDIVQFVCGYSHNLFLDSKGKVFSVGSNFFGQLGLDLIISRQNVLNQIPNIPPIQFISIVSSSSYLIDFLKSLEFWDECISLPGEEQQNLIATPTKVECLTDIQQVIHGCGCAHFLAKDSQGKIFATGNNVNGQLGTGDFQSLSIPKELSSQYFTIWGEYFHYFFLTLSISLDFQIPYFTSSPSIQM